MMPPGAAVARADPKSALAGVLHERQTDPEVGRLLAALQDEAKLRPLDPFQRVSLPPSAAPGSP